MASRKLTAKELAPEANYVIVKLGYDDAYILPYEDGVKLLECLKHAERYIDKFGKDTAIEPIGPDGPKLKLMSREHYVDLKTAQLLGITVEEVQNTRKEAA